MIDLKFQISNLKFIRYGKEIINRESESQAEVFVPRLHPLQEVRPSARLSAQVSSLPDLFSRVGAGRTDSRRCEI